MPLKLQMLQRRKRVYVLGRKGQQIYRSLTVKNAKGETVENDNDRTLKMVSKHLWTTANL